MTFKVWPRSPKSNCHLSLSQGYSYARLEEIYPLDQTIFYFNDHDLENEVNATKIESALKFVSMAYICKFGENEPIGSNDILLTK